MGKKWRVFKEHEHNLWAVHPPERPADVNWFYSTWQEAMDTVNWRLFVAQKRETGQRSDLVFPYGTGSVFRSGGQTHEYGPRPRIAVAHPRLT